MESTEIDPSALMTPAVMAGSALFAISLVGIVILWIVTLIKQFKSGDTVWGVLTIFFTAIPAIIWSFMKGRKGLGIWWLIFIAIYIVGFVLAGSALTEIMMKMSEMPVEAGA